MHLLKKGQKIWVWSDPPPPPPPIIRAMSKRTPYFSIDIFPPLQLIQISRSASWKPISGPNWNLKDGFLRLDQTVAPAAWRKICKKDTSFPSEPLNRDGRQFLLLNKTKEFQIWRHLYLNDVKKASWGNHLMTSRFNSSLRALVLTARHKIKTTPGRISQYYFQVLAIITVNTTMDMMMVVVVTTWQGWLHGEMLLPASAEETRSNVRPLLDTWWSWSPWLRLRLRLRLWWPWWWWP